MIIYQKYKNTARGYTVRSKNTEEGKADMAEEEKGDHGPSGDTLSGKKLGKMFNSSKLDVKLKELNFFAY